MRYHGYFARRGLKRRAALLLGALALVLLGASEWVLSGVTPELTEEAARGYILECVSQAVEEAWKRSRGLL